MLLLDWEDMEFTLASGTNLKMVHLAVFEGLLNLLSLRAKVLLTSQRSSHLVMRSPDF